MKYYSFSIASPAGALNRIGAEQNGRLVDMTAAAAALFAHLGEPDAADYAGFLVPPDMVSYLTRGDKARRAVGEALEFVAEGQGTGLGGARLTYAFDEVHLLAPVGVGRHLLLLGTSDRPRPG